MNQSSRQFAIVFTCVSIAASLRVSAQAPAGRVEEKERIVEASPPPNRPWIPADVGRELSLREKVGARDLSRAVVRLSNQHVLRVNENSQIVILPSLVDAKPLGIELQKGEIYLHSRGLPSEMGLRTPVVTGTPRGTQFRVRVDADGTTTFTMFEGEVTLQNGHGSLRIGNNEQAIIKPGRAPARTAVIDARGTIQWCLYYPGVLHLPDLNLSPADARTLQKSVTAYESGDLRGALDRWPRGYVANSAGGRIFRAMVLLSVGQVDDARTALARVPGSSPGRRSVDEMIDAVNFRTRTTSGEPTSASEWLSRSYYEQSQSHLEAALEAAQKAAAIAPDFGYAAARVAELEFSFGRTRPALRELERSLKLAPRNAQAHALRGFLLSAENRIGAASDSFDEAIRLDSALGNAWLGRGLCKIRRGDAEAGRRDLQVATILEPNRSLFHSYLGKASGLVGNGEAAGHDLDFAKKLDPGDPTPWLYSALQDEQKNRFNDAVGQLDRSIELNDNRRLYRSEFLLDQDRAVRSANLARIYQRAGLNDVAVREATRAVESDYTSASAHLFLANSFDALRDPTRIQLRYETPWFNELLLANMLSPVGGGSLSQFVSQQEYSKLFEADGAHFSSDTEWRGDGIVRENASIFGTFGNFSFALDGSYYTENGTRPNNSLSLAEVYATFKFQVTPDDTLLFLTKWADQEQGDLFQTYDHTPLEPFVDFEEKQEPGLLLAGWNHRWAPGSNTLFLAGRLSAEQRLASPSSGQTLVQRDSLSLIPGFVTRDPMLGDSFTDPRLAAAVIPPVSVGLDGQSLIYSRDFLKSIAPFVGHGAPLSLSTGIFDFYTLRQFELTTAELQHIWQTKYNTAVIGGRWVEGDFETDTLLSIARPTFLGGFSTPAAAQHSDTSMHRLSLYAYDTVHPAPWLTLIGGVSWDRIEHPDNFRNPPVNDRERKDERISGKAGFTLAPCKWFTIRGVYAEGLGGVTFDESVRLEPVQIAGFNQAFRTVISESLAGSVETPLYKNYGLSIEGRLPTRTWWGAAFNVVEQDVERTLGTFDGYDFGLLPISPAFFQSSQRESLAYREETLSASIHQLLGDEFSLSASYRFTHAQLRVTRPEFITLDPSADQQGEGVLHHVLVAANWNSPTGLFARAEANWYAQELDGANFQGGITNRPGDDFWQFNALVGYRFARNRCEISAGVLNVTDTDYQLAPITYHGTLPRERTAVIRCKFTF